MFVRDLVAFNTNTYGWHFTFVGNIDVAKAKPILELYLGSLPATKKENKFTYFGLSPVKGFVGAAITKGLKNKVGKCEFKRGRGIQQ